MKTLRWRTLPLILAATLGASSLAGCGHSEEEWKQKQAEVDSWKSRFGAADKARADEEQSYNDALKQIDDLKQKMQQLGIDYEGKLGKSEQEKTNLAQALAEYKTRADQLDAMKKRFQDLKARLDKLTSAGLKVTIRHNRMIINLPGDILFDSGVDSLKPDGKKVLKQVADAINGDETLKVRTFQVAGHTDNAEYGNGAFHDNWGLSVARARSVLVFLVAKDPPGPGVPVRPGVPSGGNLNPHFWSAAGYGIMDPVAGTVESQTPEQMKLNRRVEIVLQPDVAEMLNLKDFGDIPPTGH
jgi:chemotaxis protein MotB